jgi:hypothetical protein
MKTLKNVAVLLLASAMVLHAETRKLSIDQNAVLEDARAYALRYVHQLPDFICTQITHREVNTPIGSTPPPVMRVSNDIVEEQLTFTGGNESYLVLAINGKVVSGVSHLQLSGAVSWGEFGSQFAQIFDPASGTTFAWDGEESVRGQKAWAFKYYVPRKSGITVADQHFQASIVVSYSGRIVIDPETKDVLEISSTLDIPANFPIHNVTRQVLYASQDIGGKKFCLPQHAEIHMEEGRKIYDNLIDFKDYHHFSSESTIHNVTGTPR